MRIAIHVELKGPSRFGALCYELAYIYLGHLGTDNDLWWPGRQNLNLQTIEIEAESFAYIVTTRIGLSGFSNEYLSGHMRNNELPESVSMDLIAKVSGKLEQMKIRFKNGILRSWLTKSLLQSNTHCSSLDKGILTIQRRMPYISVIRHGRFLLMRIFFIWGFKVDYMNFWY
ncbi:MAG: hypothetical protein NG747_01065 [Candidatus Brocadia sp.]|nr:hypothetical protein [Candidatus Brocadia sp.]